MTGGEVRIRTAVLEDYERIMTVMPGWWNGRDLREGVRKVYFRYFSDTIFIAENDGELVGFLLGFFSQTHAEQACLLYAGVDPRWRHIGLGRQLTRNFFQACRDCGRSVLFSSTSPGNRESIHFHQSLGFLIQPGDGDIDGLPVTSNYHNEGDPKVVFMKILPP